MRTDFPLTDAPARVQHGTGFCALTGLGLVACRAAGGDDDLWADSDDEDGMTREYATYISHRAWGPHARLFSRSLPLARRKMPCRLAAPRKRILLPFGAVLPTPLRAAPNVRGSRGCCWAGARGDVHAGRKIGEDEALQGRI